MARQVRVHGQVQGVFFRDTCAREASSRGVTGWVRNDDSGTVTAHFEGEEQAVSSMVEWASSGPPRAHVTDLEDREVEPQGYSDFTVR